MQTISGSVCVYRLPSVNGLNARGYRWIIQFESLTEDPSTSNFFVDYSGMVFSDPDGSQIFVSAQPADMGLYANNICTLRTAEYKDGSGTMNLIFQYTVLPGDETSSLNIIDGSGPQLILSTHLDKISLATNAANASKIE
eukprot:13170270-Ditylum_brightwellii.AAC.1